MIYVEGMTYQGFPFAYCEAVHPNSVPNAVGETFPIVVPAGVKIRAAGGSDVYIWKQNSSSGSVFKTPGTIGQSYSAELKQLRIVGSDTGVQISNTSSHAFSVSILGCVFTKNETGVRCTAPGGGSVDSLFIKNCVIDDTPVQVATGVSPPQVVSQLRGISLVAQESGSTPGRIDAEVVNLQTQGTFDQISPGVGDEARLIELLATGESREIGNSVPVAFVELDLLGSIVDGQRGGSGGWDVGVYASSGTSAEPVPRDYASAFEVSLAGTVLKKFRKQGIHASANSNSRGAVHLNGNTDIRGNGPKTGPAGGAIGTGVYCEETEAYLQLTATDAKVRANGAHGVLAVAKNGPLEGGDDPLGMPIGLYMEFRRSEFYGNAQDGIHCTAGSSDSQLPTGVVGGARVIRTNGNGYDYRTSGSAGFLPSGQGVMNRCTVHNNLGKGINFDIFGAGVGFLRTTNTIFWNNTEEGFFATVGNGGASSYSPKLACPLIHCSLAGNGDAVGNNGHNIEVLVPNLNAEFVVDPNSSADTLATKFYNSIIERKIHENNLVYPDWGPIVGTLLHEESSRRAVASEIGCLGNLESDDIVGLVPSQGQGDAEWSISPAPFAARVIAGGNGVDWDSEDPSQFFVASSAGGNAYYNMTPKDLGGMSAADLSTDFEGNSRSIPNGSSPTNAWKGADEKW